MRYSTLDICNRLKTRVSTVHKNATDELNPQNMQNHLTGWTKAAVLIPIVEREGQAFIILTERSQHLRKHSGQISFPGGKQESADRDAKDTALREAYEEIHLLKKHVEIIGEQPLYHMRTGFEITPIIGIVDDMAKLKANSQEVAKIFEVPFSFLMDGANHQRISRIVAGEQRSFYAIEYQNYYIWGATAGMIRALYERLYA